MEIKSLIMWEGKEEEVIQSRMTYGGVRDSIRKSIKLEVENNKEKRVIDLVDKEDWQVLASIKQAPFELTLENLRSLDWQDGELLRTNHEKINLLSDERKNL